MLFERQKHLLALIEALGGEIGNLDFQKLLFPYCREIQPKPSYEFVPYRFGGFSFTSYADKRRLTERGMLANNERAWKLTPLGCVSASLAPADRLRINQFARHHVGLRGDALIAATVQIRLQTLIWRIFSRLIHDGPVISLDADSRSSHA